jgi:putative spermidine/putrescine transport system permease protein
MMDAMVTAAPWPQPKDGLLRRVSDFLSGRRGFYLALLLAPPLLWLGIVYIGSLLALLAHALFSVDEFAGTIVYEPTFKTLIELFQPANFDILVRTVTMAALVTLASIIIAFPIAFYAARYAQGWMKALFYFAIMLPLWSSYLVKVYAWKLILAKEGILAWSLNKIGLLGGLEALLAVEGIGGASLSTSYIGAFLVFTYIWLPYMILPMQAALERVPKNMIEASGDLGATPRQTLFQVILPLALPGIIAGSIFTFSLTLGDYIIPNIVGPSSLFIGQAVYTLQGTAGNIPLAAAFSIVPIVIMGIYLMVARRMGAFNAL